jgi:HAAS domain-containing protein
MTTLVDRYVYTTLRRVPEKQREDIDRELRGSIEDAVEARIEAGEARETAIENTLTDLGDPDRLADSYADRPHYLIGPELFPVWRRLMITLFSVVLPIVVIVSVVVQLIDDPSIGTVIGDAIGTILTVGVHLAFWTTAVFAVVERTGCGKAGLRTTWSLKDLPQYEPRAMSRMQLCAFLVWPVILIAALVLQQFTFTDVPVLDPANWTFWWPYFIAIIAVRAAWGVWVYRLGNWTRASAVANALLVLAGSIPLVWLLATDHVYNPAFPQLVDAGLGEANKWITVFAIAGVVLTSLWDVIDNVVRVERTRRGLPTKVTGTGGSYNFG